jgi:hypothetical protein
MVKNIHQTRQCDIINGLNDSTTQYVAQPEFMFLFAFTLFSRSRVRDDVRIDLHQLHCK